MASVTIPGSSTHRIPLRKPPGPKAPPIIGLLPKLKEGGFLPLMHDLRKEYGDLVFVDFGPIKAYLVSNPDWLHQILVENHTNYIKGKLYAKLYPLMGQGLVTSNGDFWRRQRKMAAPAFHKQAIDGFFRVFSEEALERAARWSRLPPDAGPLEIVHEMHDMTQDIVLRALFGHDLDEKEAPAIHAALNTINTEIGIRYGTLFDPPKWWPFGRNGRYWKALRNLEAFILRIIRARRQNPGDQHDLLGLLLSARDEETGEGMSDQHLLDELKTLHFAGHETSANALSWTWLLLDQHPEVRKKAEAELDEVLGDRDPTLSDLPRLKYLQQVIDESLRVYPPIHQIARSALKEDRFGDFIVPAGTDCMMNIYTIHRHPKHYDLPEEFIPERWTDEFKERLHRYAYMPFGGGPRICIGNNFALMEIKTILAILLRRFRVRLKPDHPIDILPITALRPRYGLPMFVGPRR